MSKSHARKLDDVRRKDYLVAILNDCVLRRPSDLWSGLFCVQADIFVLISAGEMECQTLSIWTRPRLSH